MKVLLIGSGGREHAIAWKLSESPLVDSIYCAPGNGGTERENKCVNINITEDHKLIKFALHNNIDITFVGPEMPLVEGIVDKFKAAGLKIFGPDKKAALLEGSKAYAKDFMKKYGVKTAAYEVFYDADSALKYLFQCSYPIVIKADGLAAGKGVVICKDFEESKACIEGFMSKDILKGAGQKIVVEEYLEGVEASILAATDGISIIPFLSAKDHKTIFEDNKGANTGGMGAVSPNHFFIKDAFEEFKKEIMYPTLRGIAEENMNYIGIIFFGIMITKKGIFLLEYNVRMGDPETQAVLPLMESDFLELIIAALNKELGSFKIKWKNKYSVSVVAASKGYPEKYETGFGIKGIEDIKQKVFIAGAEYSDNEMITCSGRVLSVTALGDTIEEARAKAYEEIRKIEFNGVYYRKDIGN